MGVLSLDATSPLDGPLPPLLAPRTAEADRDRHGLLLDLVRRTGVAERLEPCARAGTLEITTTYERYHLQVTRRPFEFRLTVPADGRFDGDADRARPPGAVAEDPDLGHCTGSDLPMFRIGITARARRPSASSVRSAEGREPDFKLSCSGGTIDIGGDFIRTAFLPCGVAPSAHPVRDGATATSKDRSQGRR